MQETFVRSGTMQLWTYQSGEGLPLLLCNGGPGCCDYLGDVADMMSDLAQVIRWEQRGCGRSDASDTYTVAQTINDMEVIRQHYGFDSWLVGGHSWGADLTLLYALAHPERVMGAICIAGGRMSNDREWHKAYTAGREAGEIEPEYTYPFNQDVNQKLSTDHKRYIQDPFLFSNLARLAVPAIFIYGSEDIRPSWAVEQVAYLLPRGDFREIQGAPHAIWMTHPYALRSALREYVARFNIPRD